MADPSERTLYVGNITFQWEADHCLVIVQVQGIDGDIEITTSLKVRWAKNGIGSRRNGTSRFLKNSSEDESMRKCWEICQKILINRRADFVGFTRPTAIEISELKEYVLVEVLKSMFPVTCEESYILDFHSEERGIVRRESVMYIWICICHWKARTHHSIGLWIFDRCR